MESNLTDAIVEATGAILLSRPSRGVNLYDQAGHDSNAFVQALGDVPLGGCFCYGEIGPVRGVPYLHSFTSGFGVLREKQKREMY
jgi:small ligand-binding sensory domain FIST